jgi:hypothetical protein
MIIGRSGRAEALGQTLAAEVADDEIDERAGLGGQELLSGRSR